MTQCDPQLNSGLSELADVVAQHLARGSTDLPMVPQTAQACLRLASAPDVDLQAVARTVGEDPPLAARFMAVANSPIYFRGVEVDSVGMAVMRLGSQAVRDLLFLSVYSGLVFKVPRYQGLVEEVFDHSVLTARTARRLATQSRTGVSPSTAFLVGLLHDIGKARCLKLVADQAPSTAEIEAMTIANAFHCEAGASLAVRWTLPDPVVEACRFHHNPGKRPAALLVAAADRIAHMARTGHAHTSQESEPTDVIDEEQRELWAWLNRLEVPTSTLPPLVEQAQRDSESMHASSSDSVDDAAPAMH